MKFEKYEGIVGYSHEWAMDRIHIEIIARIAAGGFLRNVMEIGTFEGASATAWLNAIDLGVDLSLTCVDIKIRPKLHRLRKAFPAINVKKTSSLKIDFAGYDCIVVDGNHSEANVRKEQDRLHAVGVPSVFAHDTACHRHGWRRAKGPHNLAESFRDHPDYCCWEDDKYRVGMKTERGLFFAAKKEMAELCDLADRVFSEVTKT